MADRYFVPEVIQAERVVLAGDEAHHLAQVLRATPGAEVTLFDGSGAEFPARVLSVGRGRVELEVLGRREISREPPIELTLAVALPKGDRQKWLVEKAVELGVARLVPLVTARSVVRPDPSAVERLGRWVIEASKQCGRNRLMEIGPPAVWPEYVSATAGVPLRLVAHPAGGEPMHAMILDGLSRVATVAIGPEGGFTADEVHLALAAGWRSIDLGPRILRVETAALAVAAQLAGRVS